MSIDAFKNTLIDQLARWGLSLTTAQVELLGGHYEAMLMTNRLHNLTRITDPCDAALQLYADSLAAWAWLVAMNWQPSTLLDVGSGAGFPAFPLAVAMPSTRVIAIDGRGKKTRFLKETAETLNVRNLECIHNRAEEFVAGEGVEMVTFKAVGSLSECIVMTKRLLRRGGKALMFKSANLKTTEEKEAESVAGASGLLEGRRWDYVLGNEQNSINRCLCIYQRR